MAETFFLVPSLARHSQVTISIDILTFNTLPEVQKPANATTSLTVLEDSTIAQELPFVDYDSSMITIVVDSVPSEGELTYNLGGETKKLDQFSPFTPYGTQIPIEQYAKEVVGFSSAWYNDAGDWGPIQILGLPDSEGYSDSNLAWCPETKSGKGSTTNANNEPGREAVWDREATYAKFGYTEYIEVEFETPVYVSTVEVGEVRGCGSIVHVYASNSNTGQNMTLYHDEADTECDDTEGEARLTNTINRFSPPGLCNTPFLANRIRLELDTVLVPDWNELDYVKLAGYTLLPSGVLPLGVTQVSYTPNSHYFGSDEFSLYATDCGYHSMSVGEVAEYLVDVQAVPDAPVVTRISLQAAPGNASSTLDFSTSVQNLDQTALTVKFTALPSIGFVLVGGASGVAVAAGTAYDLDTTHTFYYSVASFPEEDTVVLFEYEIVDAAQSLSSKEYVEVSVQGVPVKGGLPLETILGIVAAALFVVFLVVGYVRVQHVKERKGDLAKLETMRKENQEVSID